MSEVHVLLAADQAMVREVLKQVARLLAQGFTVKEISLQRRLSLKTVETYKTRSMHKLGLASRVELMRTANDRGWCTPDNLVNSLYRRLKQKIARE